MKNRLPLVLVTDVLELLAVLLLVAAAALTVGNAAHLLAGGTLDAVVWQWPARLGTAGVLLLVGSLLVTRRAGGRS